MTRKRTSVLLLSAALALGGVSACGDDSGGNQGNRDDGNLEEDLSDVGGDISEGVEDLSDELSQQIDEGTEEDGDTSDGNG
jgi:hypothetical protein